MRAALLLAAGASRRFGRGNKLLAPLGGKPVLLHALDRVAESRPQRIVVVTGADAPRIRRLLAGRGLTLVHARDHRQGMGASLAAGLRALRPIEREALVFLGDMPAAAAPRRLRLAPGQSAVRPLVAGQPGHPLLVRTAAARHAQVRGDAGLAGRLGRIATVAGGAGNLLDLDTRRALRAVRRGSRIAYLR